MLKTVLYILLLLTTSLRLISVVFLLAAESTALPTIVLVTTSLSVFYGIFLLVRRFIFNLRLRHFVQFFAVQSAVMLFNLFFVSNSVMVALSVVEVIATGTFPDILINLTAIYYCVRSMRRRKFVTVGDMFD